MPPSRLARTETIYLVGTSGHPNFGDELITAAWLQFLATARPEADVWLDCPNPGLASHLFDGHHPRLRVTNTLWRLVGETRDMAPQEATAYVDRVVTRLGSPFYDLGLIRAHQATTVHLIGGGYMNTVWPFHTWLFRAALRLRDVGGARLVATGLGLTPVADRDALVEAANGFDHLTVRDATSAELSGAALAHDDAFLHLPQVPGFGDAAARDDDIWVCAQNDMTDPEAFEATVAAVRSALTGPELAGRTVRYLESMPLVDRMAYDRLSDLIPAENFVPFVDVWRRGFPGRAGQTWLTSRFHFHLLAAACGAEGTALEVSADYYRVKHGSLIAAGTGWSVTPTGSTSVTPPAGAGAFPEAAARLHEAKLREARGLYPATTTEPAPAPMEPANPPAAEPAPAQPPAQ